MIGFTVFDFHLDAVVDDAVRQLEQLVGVEDEAALRKALREEALQIWSREGVVPQFHFELVSDSPSDIAISASVDVRPE